MSLDPVQSNPKHFRVVFENERVRVLHYSDQPGDRTTPITTRTASCTPSRRFVGASAPAAPNGTWRSRLG
jgi:hypothetical protein